MPNGKYEPQCPNCKFYKESKDRICCSKFIFIMPMIGYELICKEWKPNNVLLDFNYDGFLKSDGLQSLSSDALYYYSYASPEPFQKFNAFKTLQNLTVSIRIRLYEDYGWSIDFPDFKEYPKFNEKSLIHLNREGFQFATAIVEAKDGSYQRKEDGEYVFVERATYSLPIYFCPDSPNAVYDWFDKLFNTDAIIKDFKNHEHSEYLLSSGYDAFLEVIQKYNEFRLLPDYLRYSKYKRH